jgi:hypothetical protein
MTGREMTAMGHQKYTTEEIARRGRELYERVVRPQVEAGNRGKVVTIDVETGDFELDGDPLQVAHLMRARHPGAALYAVRIGYPAVAKIGGTWGAAPR